MDRGKPFISIIIPVYNGKKYIAQAVNSVLSQPRGDLEVIIVNDGSIDKTEKICLDLRKKDGRIKYFKKENGGVSSARNFGLDKAEGDCIAFLDADDLWCRDVYTEGLRAKIVENPEVDIFSFEFVFCGANLKKGKVTKAENAEIAESDEALHYRLYRKHISSDIFRKNIFDEVRFNEKLRFSEDVDFLLKAVYNYKPLFCPEVLFVHRYNLSSITNSVKMDSLRYNNLKIFSSTLEYLAERSMTRNIKFCKIKLYQDIAACGKNAALDGLSLEEFKNKISRHMDMSLFDELARECPEVKSDPHKPIQRLMFSGWDAFAQELKSNRKNRLVRKLKLDENALVRYLAYSRDFFTEDVSKYIY